MMKTLCKTYLKRWALIMFIFGLCTVGCKKLVDVNAPVTSVSNASVYNSDATAIAVLTGIYSQLSGANYTTYALPTLSLYAGLSADEFTLWNGVTNISQKAYYTNSLSVSTSTGSDYWSSIFPYIFTCNAAIEGLNSSSGLTPAVKQHLLGESYFMRAFFYFYLVNLYGDVPMPLSTNYQANESLPRTAKSSVYQQIIADLKAAQGLLNVNFVDATLLNTTTERTRPNQWAATALLARVYLYTGDYTDAVTQSSLLISNNAPFILSLVPALGNVFLKNSNEAIWQLQPVSTSGSSNTYDALEFIIPSTGPTGSYPVALSSILLNSFETNDNRKSTWTGSVTVIGTTYYYPYKYKANTPTAAVIEYLMMLRLGEQYLIRAEAKANLGDATAINDLNNIRSRAGLPNYAGATDKASLLTAILHERQVEMFTELGQRWLDLKRTGTVDAVMGVVTPQKGGTWNTYQQYYPILLSDIQKDPNLSQNSGY